MADPARGDWPGALGAGLAMAIGAAAFWAAADFSDLGAVFPRAVGLLLVLMGALYIGACLLGRTRRAGALEGSGLRRCGVAVVMLAWGFALGPLGFLPSSAAAMAALVVIAHHGRWTPGLLVLCGGAVGAVLVGLYALFKLVLLVPLP